MNQGVHQLWQVPLELTLAFTMLGFTLGAPGTLTGLGVVILLIPVQFAIAMRFQKYQRLALGANDERMKHILEFMQGVRIIKVWGCGVRLRYIF